MNRIFLGGTCNNSTWRKQIEKEVNVDMFNPVVDDWTEDCQAIEMDEKENKCNVHLYVITSEMTGVFSIAEVIDSVHNKNKDTILQVLSKGFDKGQLKSLKAVVELVKLRGGTAHIEEDLSRAVLILNRRYHW
jgi:type VI protein secretion system component VasA